MTEDDAEIMTDAAEIMTDAAETTILFGKRPPSKFLSSPAIRFPRSVVAKYLQRIARMTQGRNITKFTRKLAIRSQKRAGTKSSVADDEEEKICLKVQKKSSDWGGGDTSGHHGGENVTDATKDMRDTTEGMRDATEVMTDSTEVMTDAAEC